MVRRAARRRGQDAGRHALTMRSFFRRALLVAISGAPDTHACGVCVEDKIAAVYNHAAITRALQARHAIVFFAIEGVLPPGVAGLQKVAATAASVPGVDKKGVRISRHAASLAIEYDPQRADLAVVQKALDGRLAAMGLSLLAMRVMDSPGELAAIRR